MSDIYKNPEAQRNISIFKDSLASLKKGRGAIICISGETGFGKTHLLNTYSIECQARGEQLQSAMVETSAPIGNFNVGTIQPLQPFTRAIEYLMADEASAKKNLARNLVMTGLSVIPVAGDLFWAIKEAGKDWREFKKEKSSESTKKVSSATADIYDTLMAISDKVPLILLMDDMHWADAQSVELMNMLADNISKIPVVIAFTCRMDVLHAQGTPLLSFIERRVNKDNNIYRVELNPFDKKQISSTCGFFLPNYKPNHDFEEWIYEHSYGVPGVVMEYLHYFMENPPFDDSGQLQSNFGQGDFLPATVQSTFSQLLGKLNDEERNILATCAAEGREFSAIIISELINSDILSTIKKLRSLQNKTGIIKSKGARHKYGVKTTVYKFTQAFYHTFFERNLEYEEHVALHGQIAATLRKRYDDAENEAVREQIAPYLAAHSAESGDEDMAKDMLMETARHAKKYGSAEIIKDAYDNYVSFGNTVLAAPDDTNSEAEPDIDFDAVTFREMVKTAHAESDSEYKASDENSKTESSANSNGGISEFATMEFNSIRKAVIKKFLERDFISATDLAQSYMDDEEVTLDDAEKAQLLAIIARCKIETNDFDSAENYCREAQKAADNSNNELAECIAINTFALLRFSQERYNDAIIYLQDIAKKALKMPVELRLLTISNIYRIMDKKTPEKARQFRESAAKLSSELKYRDFQEEALN